MMLAKCVSFRSLNRIFVVLAVLNGALVWPLMAGQTPPSPARPEVSAKPTQYRPAKISRHAHVYYEAVWGIDVIALKYVESGELIRFSYRVLDPEKAQVLNDKTINAFLVAPDAGVRLSVPTLEKVGQLRQSSTPEAGRSYWMAFSNPGRRVKPGDRVNLVIGKFTAEDLIVD